jgi:hypothetical protein
LNIIALFPYCDVQHVPQTKQNDELDILEHILIKHQQSAAKALANLKEDEILVNFHYGQISHMGTNLE